MRPLKTISLLLFFCLTSISIGCVSVPKKAATVSGEFVHQAGKSRERCVDWLTRGDLTEAKWNLLLDELDAEPPEIRKKTIARLQLSLDHWPDELRTMPKHWRPIDLERRADVATLIRHFNGRRLNRAWHAMPLTVPMPHLTTISLRTVHQVQDLAKNPKNFPKLQHVHLYMSGNNLKDAINALVSSKLAPQLVTLDMGYGHTANLFEVLNTDQLTSIKHLRLSRVYYNPKSKEADKLRKFVLSPRFGQLHSFAFRTNRPGVMNDILNAVEQRSGTLSNLHTLDIAYSGLKLESLAILSKSRKWVALKNLNLMGNFITPDMAKMISQAPIFLGLKTLNLRLTRLSDQAVNWLGYTDLLQQVEHLDLSRNQITDAGLWRLLGYGKLKQLKTLRLQGNKLHTSAGAHFKKAKNLNNLTLLDLRWNSIGDQGIEALAKSEMNIEHILLTRNNITARGIKALVKAKWAPNLKTIDLSENDLSDEGVIALSTIKAFPAVVRLRRTNITDAGLKAILSSDLLRLTEKLDLSYNHWSHKGASAWGTVKTLERLNLLNIRYTNLGKPENLEKMANSPSTLHLAFVRMSFERIDVGDKKKFQNVDSAKSMDKKQISLGLKMAGNIPALGEKVIKSPYLSAVIRRQLDHEVQKSIRFLEDDPRASEEVPSFFLSIALSYLKRMDKLNREKLPAHALPPRLKPNTKLKAQHEKRKAARAIYLKKNKKRLDARKKRNAERRRQQEILRKQRNIKPEDHRSPHH